MPPLLDRPLGRRAALSIVGGTLVLAAVVLIPLVSSGVFNGAKSGQSADSATKGPASSPVELEGLSLLGAVRDGCTDGVERTVHDERPLEEGASAGLPRCRVAVGNFNAFAVVQPIVANDVLTHALGLRDHQWWVVVATPGPLSPSQVAAVTSAAEARLRIKGITSDGYGALRTGMSYSDAVAILGRQGVEQSRVDIADTLTVLYRWSEAGGGSIVATFQNGALVTKSQFALR